MSVLIASDPEDAPWTKAERFLFACAGVDRVMSRAVRWRDPKNGHAPPHIDVNATDRDQDAELERLLAAGAAFVDIGQPDHVPWHVPAEQEGNAFCLLRTRLAPL